MRKLDSDEQYEMQQYLGLEFCSVFAPGSDKDLQKIPEAAQMKPSEQPVDMAPLSSANQPFGNADLEKTPKRNRDSLPQTESHSLRKSTENDQPSKKMLETEKWTRSIENRQKTQKAIKLANSRFKPDFFYPRRSKQNDVGNNHKRIKDSSGTVRKSKSSAELHKSIGKNKVELRLTGSPENKQPDAILNDEINLKINDSEDAMQSEPVPSESFENITWLPMIAEVRGDATDIFDKEDNITQEELSTAENASVELANQSHRKASLDLEKTNSPDLCADSQTNLDASGLSSKEKATNGSPKLDGVKVRNDCPVSRKKQSNDKHLVQDENCTKIAITPEGSSGIDMVLDSEPGEEKILEPLFKTLEQVQEICNPIDVTPVTVGPKAYRSFSAGHSSKDRSKTKSRRPDVEVGKKHSRSCGAKRSKRENLFQSDKLTKKQKTVDDGAESGVSSSSPTKSPEEQCSEAEDKVDGRNTSSYGEWKFQKLDLPERSGSMYDFLTKSSDVDVENAQTGSEVESQMDKDDNSMKKGESNKRKRSRFSNDENSDNPKSVHDSDMARDPRRRNYVASSVVLTHSPKKISKRKHDNTVADKEINDHQLSVEKNKGGNQKMTLENDKNHSKEIRTVDGEMNQEAVLLCSISNEISQESGEKSSNKSSSSCTSSHTSSPACAKENVPRRRNSFEIIEELRKNGLKEIELKRINEQEIENVDHENKSAKENVKTKSNVKSGKNHTTSIDFKKSDEHPKIQSSRRNSVPDSRLDLEKKPLSKGKEIEKKSKGKNGYLSRQVRNQCEEEMRRKSDNTGTRAHMTKPEQSVDDGGKKDEINPPTVSSKVMNEGKKPKLSAKETENGKHEKERGSKAVPKTSLKSTSSANVMKPTSCVPESSQDSSASKSVKMSPPRVSSDNDNAVKETSKVGTTPQKEKGSLTETSRKAASKKDAETDEKTKKNKIRKVKAASPVPCNEAYNAHFSDISDDESSTGKIKQTSAKNSPKKRTSAKEKVAQDLTGFDALASLLDEAQERRLAQELPGYNWLEEKIKSGDITIYSPTKKTSAKSNNAGSESVHHMPLTTRSHQLDHESAPDKSASHPTVNTSGAADGDTDSTAAIIKSAEAVTSSTSCVTNKDSSNNLTEKEQSCSEIQQSESRTLNVDQHEMIQIGNRSSGLTAASSPIVTPVLFVCGNNAGFSNLCSPKRIESATQTLPQLPNTQMPSVKMQLESFATVPAHTVPQHERMEIPPLPPPFTNSENVSHPNMICDRIKRSQPINLSPKTAISTSDTTVTRTIPDFHPVGTSPLQEMDVKQNSGRKRSYPSPSDPQMVLHNSSANLSCNNTVNLSSSYNEPIVKNSNQVQPVNNSAVVQNEMQPGMAVNCVHPGSAMQSALLANNNQQETETPSKSAKDYMCRSAENTDGLMKSDVSPKSSCGSLNREHYPSDRSVPSSVVAKSNQVLSNNLIVVNQYPVNQTGVWSHLADPGAATCYRKSEDKARTTSPRTSNVACHGLKQAPYTISSALNTDESDWLNASKKKCSRKQSEVLPPTLNPNRTSNENTAFISGSTTDSFQNIKMLQPNIASQGGMPNGGQLLLNHQQQETRNPVLNNSSRGSTVMHANNTNISSHLLSSANKESVVVNDKWAPYYSGTQSLPKPPTLRPYNHSNLPATNSHHLIHTLAQSPTIPNVDHQSLVPNHNPEKNKANIQPQMQCNFRDANKSPLQQEIDRRKKEVEYLEQLARHRDLEREKIMKLKAEKVAFLKLMERQLFPENADRVVQSHESFLQQSNRNQFAANQHSHLYSKKPDNYLMPCMMTQDSVNSSAHQFINNIPGPSNRAQQEYSFQSLERLNKKLDKMSAYVFNSDSKSISTNVTQTSATQSIAPSSGSYDMRNCQQNNSELFNARTENFSNVVNPPCSTCNAIVGNQISGGCLVHRPNSKQIQTAQPAAALQPSHATTSNQMTLFQTNQIVHNHFTPWANNTQPSLVSYEKGKLPENNRVPNAKPSHSTLMIPIRSTASNQQHEQLIQNRDLAPNSNYVNPETGQRMDLHHGHHLRLTGPQTSTRYLSMENILQPNNALVEHQQASYLQDNPQAVCGNRMPQVPVAMYPASLPKTRISSGKQNKTWPNQSQPVNNQNRLPVNYGVQNPLEASVWHSCQYCGADAKFMCSNCETVQYCNRDCQMRDWDKHAEVCLSSKIQRNILPR